MSFYMNYYFFYRLSKFQKMKAAVERRDWEAASDEMKNSEWFTQVGRRGVDLVTRMNNVK